MILFHPSLFLHVDILAGSERTRLTSPSMSPSYLTGFLSMTGESSERKDISIDLFGSTEYLAHDNIVPKRYMVVLCANMDRLGTRGRLIEAIRSSVVSRSLFVYERQRTEVPLCRRPTGLSDSSSLSDVSPKVCFDTLVTAHSLFLSVAPTTASSILGSLSTASRSDQRRGAFAHGNVAPKQPMVALCVTLHRLDTRGRLGEAVAASVLSVFVVFRRETTNRSISVSPFRCTTSNKDQPLANMHLAFGGRAVTLHF